MLIYAQRKKRKLKPKPDTWDSDLDGEWADQPGALMHTDAEEEDEDVAPKKPAPRARAGAAATSQKKAAAPKKAPPAKPARGRRKVFEEEEDEEEDEDVIMVDDDDDEEDDALFVKPSRTTVRKPAAKAPARAKSPVKKAPARATKQSTLNFSQSQTSTRRSQQPSRAARTTAKKVQEPVSNGARVYLITSAKSIYRVTTKYLMMMTLLSLSPAPVP
jgi:double-strand break repair protein MRE11